MRGGLRHPLHRDTMTDRVYFKHELDHQQEVADEIIAVCQHVLSEDLLLKQIDSQLRQWGVQKHSLQEWTSYLTEEVGEAARYANKRMPVEMACELVQVMALCIHIMHYAGGEAFQPEQSARESIDTFMGNVSRIHDADYVWRGRTHE
jgi:NTP pyrophosphatase (non-canonical NTP hydrolase)